MFLTEPQRTQFDLHFHVAGIPVRVHPLFWLFGVILGASGGDDGNVGAHVLIWVSVLFVSILIHELGHAFTMQWMGESPRVVLYMMGGLAISDGGRFSPYGGGASRTPRNQIIISAAGPGAGFVLAALVAAIVYAMGGRVAVVRTDFLLPLAIPVFRGESISPYLHDALYALLFINVFWGLINLLPVYPLDGGQIARQLFMTHDPWNGVLRSLWLSVFVGGSVALIGFAVAKEPFLGMLFGVLALSSYLTIQQMHGGGGGGFGGGGRGW